MMSRPRRLLRATAAAAALAFVASGAPKPAAAQTLVAVLEAEVATLDPHFTTAYITRSFGYMAYDTLFGMAANGEMRPQMAQDATVSADGLTWRITLRDGLAFHDGAPVTAADVVASIKRWQPRAAMGRLLAAAMASLEVIDAKTFELRLKQPFGLVREALGRPNTAVPFILPERLVAAAGDQKVTEIIGSGPFVFRQDLYRPGDRVILDRNPNYRPRPEPNDFFAGGKVVKIERLELRTMPDGATAASALQAGEVDYLQIPQADLLPLLMRNRSIVIDGQGGMNAYQGYFRLNHAAPPFDDPAIRQVLWKLFDQNTVPVALGLPPAMITENCRSFFMCGTPYETTQGGERAMNPSVAAAREALKQTRYNGEKVVVMQGTDIEVLRVSSAVAADLLTQAGFNVELQAMAWGTRLNRRARPDGWAVFGVTASGFDLASPLTHFYLTGNCVDYAGWSCEPRMTPLCGAFAAASDEAERKRIAGQISELAFENVPAVMWGQFVSPAAWRNSLSNVIPSSIPVFWSVEKK